MNKISILPVLFSAFFLMPTFYGSSELTPREEDEQSSVEVAFEENDAEGEEAYAFNSSGSEEELPRYQGRGIILQNLTGGNLENLRILGVFRKDESQPFIPENTTEVMLRFLASSEEVMLPCSSLSFSLEVYAGNFDEEASHSLDVIRDGRAVSIFDVHGEEFPESTKTIRLSVALVGGAN